MLYKKTKHNDIIWRYWCECGNATHVLEFSDWNDENYPKDLHISITNKNNNSILNRFKQAFQLIFGQKICYADIVINEEDRKELAAALRGVSNNEDIILG